METNQSSDMIPQSLDMISQWCKNLVLEVESQPLKRWIGSLHDQSKVLLVSDPSNKSILHSWYECRACDIIVENAQKLTSVKTWWHIHPIGCGSMQLYRTIHKHPMFEHPMLERVGNGLELRYYQSLQISPKDHIWESIDLVITHLKQGWEKKSLVDFPDIPSCHKYDESVWILYTKNPLLSEEDDLMRFLIGMFLMDDNVVCDSTQHYIYLWIRREKMDVFAQKFWHI